MLLATGWQRTKKLLNILQCPGQPPPMCPKLSPSFLTKTELGHFCHLSLTPTISSCCGHLSSSRSFPSFPENFNSWFTVTLCNNSHLNSQWFEYPHRKSLQRSWPLCFLSFSLHGPCALVHHSTVFALKGLLFPVLPALHFLFEKAAFWLLPSIFPGDLLYCPDPIHVSPWGPYIGFLTSLVPYPPAGLTFLFT